MSEQSLLDEIIKETFDINPASLDQDQKFLEMEIWDSMTFMIFITNIEDKFDIALTGDEIIEMDCLKKTKEIIERKTV